MLEAIKSLRDKYCAFSSSHRFEDVPANVLVISESKTNSNYN